MLVCLEAAIVLWVCYGLQSCSWVVVCASGLVLALRVCQSLRNGKCRSCRLRSSVDGLSKVHGCAGKLVELATVSSEYQKEVRAESR